MDIHIFVAILSTAPPTNRHDLNVPIDAGNSFAVISNRANNPGRLSSVIPSSSWIEGITVIFYSIYSIDVINIAIIIVVATIGRFVISVRIET